jgi:hypothetical protein
VRIAAADRAALIEELAGKGADLVSLNPVRKSLEDLLVEQFEERVS